MDNEVLPVGDISESNGKRNFYFSLKSDNSLNEDYVYQLEYEKRKYIDQIENLQQQLDLSDRRNAELSEDITSLNILNHRFKDAVDENRSLHDAIDMLTQSEVNLKERCRQLSSSLADCELKCSEKEQELKSLETNLQNIKEHEAHLDDTGYHTSEPVSQLHMSNFDMNKCECKSIGEEIVDALNECSVYEVINETEHTTNEDKEVIQTEGELFEQSPILQTESAVNMRR
ncbi:unnamed protein product [Rodentolepis nana]|uniref:HAP1 N-terminal domain-containing protein n=1 Tax=Rodentolepis nana TaxID=102285 RepID=A0A0R3TT42_RODNA|nr:unnamed protein product [Rodentolepis nana]